MFQYICTMKIKKVYIGKAIKELVDKNYTSYAAFARNLGKTRQYVHSRIFAKKDLSTALLIQISEELDINLFELYQNEEKNVSENNNSPEIGLNLHINTTKEELVSLGIYDTLIAIIQKKTD